MGTGSSAPAPGAGVWFWRDDMGNWQPYKAELSTKLETAYIASTASVTLKVGRFTYQVDFGPMTQTNTTTAFARPIRRGAHPTATAGHAPGALPGWSWLDDSGWKSYQPAHASILDAAKARGDATVDLRIGSTTYRVDFTAMSQTNTTTNFSRKVSYVPPAPVAAAAPGGSAPAGSLPSTSRPLGTFVHEKCDPATAATAGDATRASVGALTGWTHPEEFSVLEGMSCSICLMDYEEDEDRLEDVVLLGQCKGHYFHADCIVQCFKHNVKCPICSKPYAAMIGRMPKGTMTITRYPPTRYSLAGNESDGTLMIQYDFPSGVQRDGDPNPGQAYSGTRRTAFLPDTDGGNEVAQLLVRAFKNRQTFIIGTSVTTGRSNTVVWNGIHHKTNRHGGATRFGYPDPDYFARVKEELALIGIVPVADSDGLDDDGDLDMTASAGSAGPGAGSGAAGAGAGSAATVTSSGGTV